MCIRYQTVVASTAFSRNSSREAARSQQPCSSRYTFLITRWIYSWHPAWRLTSSSTATTTMSLCVRAKKFGSPLAVFLSRGILFSSVLRPAEPRQLVVQSRKKLGSELFHDNYQADETRAKRSNSSPDISGCFLLRLVSNSTGVKERDPREANFREGKKFSDILRSTSRC